MMSIQKLSLHQFHQQFFAFGLAHHRNDFTQHAWGSKAYPSRELRPFQLPRSSFTLDFKILQLQALKQRLTSRTASDLILSISHEVPRSTLS